MTSLAAPSFTAAGQKPDRRRLILKLAHTVLCLGLNVAAERLRRSRYARFVIALLVLNELRGLYVVYSAAGQALPFLS